MSNFKITKNYSIIVIWYINLPKSIESASFVDVLYASAQYLKKLYERSTEWCIRLLAQLNSVSPSQSEWKKSGLNVSMSLMYFDGSSETLPPRVVIATEFRL